MSTRTGASERNSVASRGSVASERGSTGSGQGSNSLESSDGLLAPRTLALLGVVALTAGYCSTLYWVTTVGGGTTWFAGAVGLGLALGALLRGIEERTVFGIAAVGAAGATAWYYTSVVPTIEAGTLLRLIGDSLAMLSGLSVLELAAVDVWIAALVPVPVFLSTYFGLRGRYEFAVLSGGWLVVYLALTGDATVVETLVGTVGAAMAVGFGELDRRDGSITAADLLVGLVAVMAVLAVAVPMVPSGSADPLEPGSVGASASPEAGSGQGQAIPLDEALLSGNDVSAGGPINLSPEVRFVVESPSRQRWRVGVLGTYTGESWTRSGDSSPYTDALRGPRGSSRTVVQSYDLRAPAEDVPAAAYPVGVRDLPTTNLRVRSPGTLTVEDRLGPGTNYTIRSQIPTASASDLRNAGTDYPAAIERRYTSLPDGTVPPRVADLTDQVTSEAATPYDAARAIESYLEDNKDYSQDVSSPSSTLADGFLFEMDAGYCTYFAGTMATMLRAQNVPARVAVGYSSGQNVGNDTWVVRGTDAHAWVEVYFPDVGWVEFDPTPSTAVRDARRGVVETARDDGSLTVDVPESAGEDVRFEQPDDPTPDSPNGTDGTDGSSTDGTDGTSGTNGTDGPPTAEPDPGPGDPTEGNGSGANYVQPDMPTVGGSNGSSENGSTPNGSVADRAGDRLLGGLGGAVVALLLLAGTVAGGRRAGVQRRLRHAGSVLWQRRADPETDVQRAMERLDAVLERRYDAREPGETRREYRRRLPTAVDADVHRAFELYERARYGGEVDRATADELVEIVDGLARRDLPLVGDRE